MDRMTQTAPAPVLHEPPAGVRVRGALALLAGAGEAPRVYERFGRRLAADGYVVAVFETAAGEDARTWLVRHEIGPRVLAGSDRGAAAALALAAGAADGDAIDGIVVAALPVGDADDASADPAQRTACPVHLGVLAGADAASPAVAAQIAVPDAAALAALTVPVLAVHGGADPLAPFAAARAALAAVPVLELVETVGGLHDALNDQSHRSVAATVVLWLERLRADGVATPIVRQVAR
jgi:alpha-beta hydrolase superfamily lysophospholipase